MSDPTASPAVVPLPVNGSPWPVVTLSGLSLDSLGAYLAALGLLAVAARRWPAVRGCWRDGQFTLVRGPRDLAELVEVVSAVGRKAEWHPFAETWVKEKALFAKLQAAKKPDSTAPLLLWRAREAEESELTLFQAHLAIAKSARANPILRNPGGKRLFHGGWREATRNLKAPPAKKATPALLASDLTAFLSGEGFPQFVDSWNAGSWFADANKIYNGNSRSPFRNGKITPWAMALCCEAFPLFAGQASRRLASRAPSLAAFPFLSEPAAPREEGACGQSEAEFWAPVWTRPMTWAEAVALFSRGRAEVGGRGAVTPAAFSAAVVQRGVDAGIEEFRRFTLDHTTNPKTFESRLAGTVPVARHADISLSAAVGRALALRDRLPADRRKGLKWVYKGLRGPLDAALLDLAAAPDPETSRGLVDAMFAALTRVDRNREHRKAKVSFEALPAAWAARLFDAAATPPLEARLALAATSLAGSRDGAIAPWLAYRLGVERAGRRHWLVPENVPFRRVWGGPEPVANLIAVLRRRLVESEPMDPPPPTGPLRVGLADVASFLAGDLDEERFATWLDRFGLFDWSENDHNLRRSLRQPAPPAPDGALALYAFFRPLFDPYCLASASENARPVKVGSLRRVTALLDRGDLPGAVATARSAYHAAGIPLGLLDARAFRLDEPRRLLAALLLPTEAAEVVPIFHRWQLPTSNHKP